MTTSGETTGEKLHPEDRRFIIVGAGPVGLLAAILLVQEIDALQVTIYESRDGLTTDLQESYPIGVNPRGARALDRARPDMAIALRKRGVMVDAWKIYAGRRVVAEIPSGLVVGTTRSMINEMLYEEVRKHFRERIEIKWGHRLKSLDLLERRLVFDVKQPSTDPNVARTYEEVTVEGGGARMLACDGVWSEVRAFAENHVEGFKSQVIPWRVQFRLLFSKPGAGALAPYLKPENHYVMSGIYVSIIEGDVWVLALGIVDGLPAQTRELLLATEATPTRVAALRAYITKKAPLAAPFLTEEDLRLYFKRRSFRGAIVKVNRLNLGEWGVLLGDVAHFMNPPTSERFIAGAEVGYGYAAHSVIPPIGEGFNAGAEDVEVLMDAMHHDLDHPFSTYNGWRLPDLHALHELAFDANQSNFGNFGPEKISRLMTTVMVGLAKSCGMLRRTWEDMSFGVDAFPPQSYLEIESVWRWQRLFLLPLARIIVWPVYLLVWMVLWPVQLMWRVVTGPFRGRGGGGGGRGEGGGGGGGGGGPEKSKRV